MKHFTMVAARICVLLACFVGIGEATYVVKFYSDSACTTLHPQMGAMTQRIEEGQGGGCFGMVAQKNNKTVMTASRTINCLPSGDTSTLTITSCKPSQDCSGMCYTLPEPSLKVLCLFVSGACTGEMSMSGHVYYLKIDKPVAQSDWPTCIRSMTPPTAAQCKAAVAPAGPPDIGDFLSRPKPADATVAKILLSAFPDSYWKDPQSGGLLRTAVLEFEAANPKMFIQFDHVSEQEGSVPLMSDLGLPGQRGLEMYDGYFGSGGLTPSLAASGKIQDLTSLVTESAHMNFLDIVKVHRAFGMRYAGRIYQMPLDTDFLSAYYRADVLAKFGKSIPKTWAEFVEIAEAINGTDFDGDGSADFAVCDPAIIACAPNLHHFLAFFGWYSVMAAPFLQSKGTAQGAMLDARDAKDPDFMKPLIDSPAGREVLKLYKRLRRVAQAPYGKCNAGMPVEFDRGKCVMGVGLMKSRFNYTLPMTRDMTPGSDMVMDYQNGKKLTKCTASLCPYWQDGVNRAPWVVLTAGLASWLRRNGPEKSANVAWKFMEYLSVRKQSIPTIAKSRFQEPFRKSQVSEGYGAEAAFDSMGWPDADIRSAFHRVTTDLEHDNVALDIRIPGAHEYWGAITRGLKAYLSDQETEDEMIAKLTNDWNLLHEKYGGKRKQANIYRQSLGLEPLPPEDTSNIPCPKGQTYSGASEKCEACAVGKYKHVLTGPCLPCTAGAVAPKVGAETCTPCKPGYSTLGKDGATVCRPCDVGYFAAEQGQPTCQQCLPGFIAPRSGTSLCTSCELGQYVETSASTACMDCSAGKGNGKTTSAVGSARPDQCVCPANTYYRAATDTCIPCTEGIVCPADTSKAGDATQTQMKGFWAKMKADGFYQVNKCRNLFPQCPEGPPGTCAQGRTDVACANCKDEFAQTGGADCIKCEGANLAVFFLCIPVILIILYVIYFAMDPPVAVQLDGGSILSATFGGIVNFGQTVAIMVLPVLRWPGWLAPSMEGNRQTMFFDVPMMVRAGCITGSTFQGDYIMKVLPPLVLVIFMGMLFLIGKVVCNVGCLRAKLPQVTVDGTINVSGMLLTIVYIAVVKNTVSYFECSDNPAAKQTVTQYPDIVCWESDHMSMLPVGLMFLVIYCVGFFCALLVANWTAPTQIAKNAKFIVRYKFLIGRWRPDYWYFGQLCILRNLFVGLGSAMFVNFPMVHLLYLNVVLLTYLAFVCCCKPWRFTHNFRIDATLTGMLVVISCCATNLYSSNTRSDNFFASLICVLMILALCLFATMLALALYLRLNPKKHDALVEACTDEIGKNLMFIGKELSVAKIDELKPFLMTLTHMDLRSLADMLHLMHVEVLGQKTPRKNRIATPTHRVENSMSQGMTCPGSSTRKPVSKADIFLHDVVANKLPFDHVEGRFNQELAELSPQAIEELAELSPQAIEVYA